MDCKSLQLSEGTEGNQIHYAAWTDSLGDKHSYWHDEYPGHHMCQCGATASCENSLLVCNCDASLPVWLYDEGTLTDLVSLPVRAVSWGGRRFTEQGGGVTLGPLVCNGIKDKVVT
jgi:hypothetical protein